VTSYRDRIYASYSSRFQDKGPNFDVVAARRWGRAYDWYFRRWLPSDKDAYIVDLGCGAGSLLHFFRERGYSNVAGVDISPEQVSLSRQVVRNVTQDDVLHFLENHKDTIDLITALDLIEHLSKEEVFVFLDGCHAALRRGGRLILQTPNAESPWAASIRYGDFTHEVCFQPSSLTRLMGVTGFISVVGREQGPVPLRCGLGSAARFILWRSLRLSLKLYNIVETGGSGSGILTRVFLMSGLRNG